MEARSSVYFLLVLLLLGTPTASAEVCEHFSTKDLFCIKYLCRGFCHDEAVNLRGKNAKVMRAWCKGRRCNCNVCH
uniref:Knottin scorpion toxin-like domain-containing protein n=1 Tax=Leersia perrieri TaxID=77586 RepID=A0A0D9XIT0_9ORYZ